MKSKLILIILWFVLGVIATYFAIKKNDVKYAIMASMAYTNIKTNIVH